MRRSHSPIARSLVLLGLVCLSGPIASAQSGAPEQRTVAVGDIHGAHDEFLRLLEGVGLVDELGTWTGGSSTLVQTGDMLDRGAEVRRVMDLLIRLQGEAQAAGGRVVVLLGNHEIMNLVGARQDVTPEILAAFTDSGSETRQREAFREYEDLVLRRRSDYRRASASARRRVEQAWLEENPPGLVEMVRALAPDGSYGRWLRSLPMLWRADGVLYMHAGISERYASVPTDEIDERVRREVETIDRYRAHLMAERRLHETADLSELVAVASAVYEELSDYVPDHDETTAVPPALPRPDADLDAASAWAALADLDHWYLFAPEGPLWFRGYARWGYEEIRERVPGLFATIGIHTAVVGHTPQTGGIRVRAEGAVYLIDTGMLTEVYGGRGEALVLDAEGAAAIRAGGQLRRLPGPARRASAPAGRPR